MNKTELVNSIAEKTGLTKADATRALNATVDSITEEMAKGGQVQLIGFGTFKTAKREARTGRNPLTGKEIKIAATVSPKFQAGKALKEACNAKKKGKK